MRTLSHDNQHRLKSEFRNTEIEAAVLTARERGSIAGSFEHGHEPEPFLTSWATYVFCWPAILKEIPSLENFIQSSDEV
jgi:hypothetical protein